MIRQIRGRHASIVVPLILALIANPADAAGGKGGGHSGHRSAPRPPAHASAHRGSAPKAVRMPHQAASTHARVNLPHNNPAPHVNSVPHNNASVSTNTKIHGAGSASSMSLASRLTAVHPNTYAYGTGTSTRRYRPSGYGRGYRNRYYGNSQYHGRSQGNDRSLVARLRSVHSTLTRIDHDYQGHRARASHEISMAIRHLSHRSMYSNTGGFSANSNVRLTGLNGTSNRNRAGFANGNGQRNHLTQAQSDARMNQALRTTQGISLQLTHQSQNHNSHRLAYGRLQRAMREMNVALAVR